MRRGPVVGLVPLRRELGLLEATTIVVGSMIGSGIFLGLGGAASLVPDGPLVLFVFAFSGVLVLFGALTVGELAAMVPESGGHYAFIREGYGRFVAFLEGWNILLIGKGASVAALAVAFAAYAQQFFGLADWVTPVTIFLVITLLTAVNVASVRLAGWLSNVSTFAKVGALLLLVVGGLVLAVHTAPSVGPSSSNVPNAAAASAPALTVPQAGLPLLMALGGVMVFAMFAYDGWANSAEVAEEVRDPRSTVPRSLVLGIAIVMAVYLAVIFVYFRVLGASGVAGSEFAAATAAEALIGPVGRTAVLLAVMISILGTMSVVILSGPRIPFAMARDGLFPEALSHVHPRWGTPAWAILTQSAWSLILAYSGTFDQLLTVVIFTSWIFYGLATYLVIRWRRTRPYAHRPYRTPGYPVVPWIFVGVSAVFTVNTLVTQPVESLAGVGILALGVPVYLWYARKPARAPPRLLPAEEPDFPTVLRLIRSAIERSGSGTALLDVRAIAREGNLAEPRVEAAVAQLLDRGRIDIHASRGRVAVSLPRDESAPEGAGSKPAARARSSQAS
jgi:APA family basic amino acid/polyamine antiporter